MKAITLWQPWASLVAIGAKKHETRSWSTNYRGPLLIHAAKRFGNDEMRLCFGEPFRTCLRQAGYRKASDLPLGMAVAVVNLVAVFPTEDVVRELAGQEQAFGDYGPGRYAWRLENLVRFPEPVPMRGRQGLWTPTLEELESIPVRGKIKDD